MYLQFDVLFDRKSWDASLPTNSTKKLPTLGGYGSKYLWKFAKSLMDGPFPAINFWSGISLEQVNDDLGQLIGKIRYHYFQNWDFQKKLTVKMSHFI